MNKFTITSGIITDTATISNLSVSGTTTLGNIGNIQILGGNAGAILQTDGTGNLVWNDTLSATVTPGGTTGQVQFNDGGTLGGSPDMAYDGVTLTVGNLAVTGTKTFGDVTSLFVTGGSVGQFLQTDGSGNLVWATLPDTGTAATSSSLPPVSPQIGDQWFNTTTGILYIRANNGAADFWLQTASTSNTQTNLTITGNLVAGNINLPVSGLHVTGGTSGQYLRTDGVGNLTWATVSASGASYGNTEVSAYLQTGTTMLANLTTTGKSMLGDSSQVTITGGTSGQHLATDGAGNLTWVTPSASGMAFTAGTTPPGSSNLGDEWYNTTTDALYVRVFDGTNTNWVDITSTPTVYSNLAVTNTLTWSGLYTNANAAAYLPTNTANVKAASLTTLSTTYLGSYASVVSLFERAKIVASAPSATTNLEVIDGAVVYHTVSATTNFTLNLRGNSSVTLNNTLTVGDSCTVTLLVTNGATAYYPSVFTIDGSVVTPRWAGGTAITGGNANSVDAYTYTIIKTGSSAFTVLGNQTRFS